MRAAIAEHYNAARAEDIAWMARWGETLEGAARRLGCSATGLEKWLARHAPELGARLRQNGRAA